MGKYLLTVLLLPFFGGLCQEPANRASFKWFEYKGHDPVYQSHPLTGGQFHNPILQGFYPDPSICRKKGNDYYMVHSTFSFYPGVPIFHSRDLVHWEQIGHVLDRPSQLNLDGLPISYGIFAPAIEYNPYNDTFYMVTTLVGGGGNFVVKAKDPQGPWSDPVWLPDVPGIDPSLFFDDDGRAYIVNNREPAYAPIYSGHRAVWVHEYDIATDQTIGTPKVLIDGGIDIRTEPQWIEGPHLYKVNGWYYLMAAEGGTSINHSEVILRSQSPWGPFEAWEGNPILTQRDLPANRPYPVTNAGHADLIQMHDGSWWAVFLACRPYEANLFNIGRETFLLPVQWHNGWPTILDKGLPIPATVHKPGLAKPTETQWMPNGNFTIRDDFDSGCLDLSWVFIRTPRTQWYRLEDGNLDLTCEPVSISELKNPAFIGRRQQHHWFEVSARMDFQPKASENAGLVCFQNENNFYYLGVHKKGKRTVARLTKGIKGAQREVLAEIPIRKSPHTDLKIVGKGACIDFWVSTRQGKWRTVASGIDARHLSTDHAGGFVGTIIGMYASSTE
ncbi:MAG: glycoside hydrolase family 43 protein [Breznakibacter sp.]